MTENNPSKEKPGPSWIDWATRSTAVLAVLAALSSGRWGASNLRAILEQGRVNDTWAWYQADSIKAHGAEEMADLVKALNHDLPPDRKKELDKLRDKFLEAMATKDGEKHQLDVLAHEYEDIRNQMVERGFWFELSFVALQLGVILCTIAAAARRKAPWLIALAIGVIGLALLANGFHRLVKAPEGWYMGTSKAMAIETKSH